jgi:hypothetical protein
MIKSISDNQEQIIKDIIEIYVTDGRFDLDPTYSKGNFYKNIQEPKYKSDLHPQVEGVIECDCQNLSFDNESLASIMFDPPFVIGGKSGGSDKSTIIKRFGYFRNIEEMFITYKNSLAEFFRVLSVGGS